MKITTIAVLVLTGVLVACGGSPQFDGSTSDGTDVIEGAVSSDAVAVVSSSEMSVVSSVAASSTAQSSSSSRRRSSSSQLNVSASSVSSPASSVGMSSSSVVMTMSSAAMSSGSASSVANCLTPPGKSHNAGKDCLSCHKKGGQGASYAVFTVGGTAYKSTGKVQAGAMIKLYTHNSNSVAICIKTNSLGNFYTTQTVAGLASPGVDAEAEGPTGGLNTMTSVLKSGACNACHGVTAAKILVD